MTRKYYKKNLCAELLEVALAFKCPNTGGMFTIQPKPHEYHGYEGRMGTKISASIDCPLCGKHHTIYLRDD